MGILLVGSHDLYYFGIFYYFLRYILCYFIRTHSSNKTNYPNVKPMTYIPIRFETYQMISFVIATSLFLYIGGKMLTWLYNKLRIKRPGAWAKMGFFK